MHRKRKDIFFSLALAEQSQCGEQRLGRPYGEEGGRERHYMVIETNKKKAG